MSDHSLYDIFERYERRFAQVLADLPKRLPWTENGRTEIVSQVKQCLGFRENWIPEIRAEAARIKEEDGFRIEFLQASSWPGVAASALLYVPGSETGKPRALVVLCCGHGANGKLTPGYQKMARHLVQRGAMVLCPDNIGQGERVAMGHANVVTPFACGISLQGLIVMETIAWVRWALGDSRVDPVRVGAVGNSGGGTLTLFLGALCPELAVLSSSGYPSTFAHLGYKERKHCHCNILPHVVGELDMWQILGCFAPRPLFIFQGRRDSLFPFDLFMQVSRKVRHVYTCLGVEENFAAEITPGEHSWDDHRCLLLGDFLTRHLDLSGDRVAPPAEDSLLETTDVCWPSWPQDAVTADELACRLTGVRPDPNLKLWDVFPPDVFPSEAETIDDSMLQLLAQLEAFLRHEERV